MEKNNLEKITLIPFERKHIPLFHEWRNNPQLMEMASLQLETSTFEDTKYFVDHAMLNRLDGKHWIIWHQEDEKVIGYISLINIDYDHFSADCMIEIGEVEYWGKSYGKMAMKILMHHVFIEMNFFRLALQVFSFNTRAINMYRSLGFVEEGRRRNALYRIPDFHDIILMSMLREEYKNEMK